ncbi:MAG TPA: amidohydrolase family protein [Vicinamibacteria bacterium]
MKAARVLTLLASAGWLGAAVCTSAARAAEPTDVPIAITGARIVTVSGPVIEKGTLVVSGGKIAAVGPSVAVPAGAKVIDATGQTLYPGLIDGLTALGLVEIQSVAGSVDIREIRDVNAEARAWVAVNPHSEALAVTRANGITAALAAPVSGQSALLRLAGTSSDEMVVRAPVALHLAYPTGRAVFDVSRLFDEPELKTFDERQKERKKNKERELAKLHNLLEDAKAQAAALEAARAGSSASPRPDLPLESLAPFARGDAPVIIRADAEDDIRGALAFAKENGLKLIIAGGLEAWRCADVLKAADVPVLLNVLRLPGRRSDAYDAAYTVPKQLHEAGVRFAIVSDDTSFSRNLPYEAAMARAYGLPADVALRAITLSPAEIFGVARGLGSLEAGKDASLFLASGDIMDARTRVLRVLIDGKEQSLETRHTRLYEEFKDRR